MPVPPGWISVVHPEGSRYFVNQATVRDVQLLQAGCLSSSYDTENIHRSKYLQGCNT